MNKVKLKEVNLKKLMKYGVNGYFTLEAAFILSLVFWIILLIIFLAFYQYNRCLLTQDTYRIALRGSQLKKTSEQDIKLKIQDEITNWYYEKYVACLWKNPQVEITSKKVSISNYAEVLCPTIPQGLVSDNKLWKIDIEKNSKRTNPVNIIRNCRIIEKIQTNKENKGG